MTSTDSTSPHAAPPVATASPWTWLLPALTFLAGVALAGAVFAVTNAGTDSGASSSTGSGDGQGVGADASASASPTSATSSPSPTDLVVTVPQSCLDAADGVSRASQEVRAAVDAVRDLDARRLQEIVDRIQALQPEVQALADTCRASAGARLEDGTLASSAPAAGGEAVPSPTVTP